MDIEYADVSAHAGSDLACRGPRGAGAQDHHFRQPNTRGAAQENPAPAVFSLQTPGAYLNRKPAGDLAHRREQRQRAVIELNCFVAYRNHLALE